MIEMLPPPAPTEESESKKDDIRELTREEILEYCGPKYKSVGVALPDPKMSTFMGVIRGGKVVAALGLQLMLHAEPLMIDEGFSGCLTALVGATEKHVLAKAGPQWVYLMAPAGKMTQLAQSMGMKLEPWCVLSKLIIPEVVIPSKALVFDMDTLSETEVIQ